MIGSKLQQPYDLDNLGDYQVDIDVEHHKIHEGCHYACQDYDDEVDTGGPKYWNIVTPDTATRVHFSFNLISSKEGLVEFFENPTLNNNGTGLTAYNSDRNSANTSELECYYNPSVLSDGSNRLGVNVIGTDSSTGNAGGSGGAVGRTDEFILKPNEQYLIKYTSGKNDARVSCCFKWYEI